MTSRQIWGSLLTLTVYLLFALCITGCGKPTLDTINLEPGTATLTVGETLQLRATGLDSKGRPMPDLAFTWSVDGPQGRIEATGLFTAVQPGTATVTVSVGTVTRTATLSVERQKVARLITSDVPADLPVGTTATVTVTAQDAMGQGIANVPVQAQSTSKDTTVTPPTATTDATGQAAFTMTLAQQVSANQVQLRADAQQATVTIQGHAGAPAVLQLNAATTVVVGEEVRLQASVQDEAGNPIPGIEIQFAPLSVGASLTPAQATTDVQGSASTVVKTSPKAGVNRLQVSVAGLSPQAVEIHGRAAAPGRLTLQAEPAETVAGGMVTLSILVHDAHGNAVANVPVDVAATPEDAALEGKAVTTDASGTAQVRLQTSTVPGENTIEARLANLPPAHITIPGNPPITLSLEPQTATIDMLGSQRFLATVADAQGHSIAVLPTWKVVGESGRITADGTFTAGKLGNDAIVATYADLTAGAQLTVIPGAVATIRVTPSEATLVSGSTQQFHAEAFNAHQYALEITPTWSVRHEVGSVDTSGLFTATKAGTGEVVVTVDARSQSARLTVKAGELAAISVTPEHLLLKAGEDLQLHAQGRDAAGNSIPIEAVWSLAVNLGELDPGSGVFRALHAGKGQLRVEAGPRPTVAEIPVEVIPAKLEKIDVSPQTLTMSAGEELAFTATGYDAFGNAISITPVWALTADLGTLTPQGSLHAQRTGATLIRATIGEVSGQASVIIKPGKLTSLSLDPPGPLVLAAGETVSLATTGQDAFGNIVAVTPTWSQSEPSGTLSDDGTFRAETVGMTEVIARSGEQRATVQISITPGKLAKIALTPAATTMLAGETLPFKATGLDAFNNEVPIQPTWRLTDDIGEITAAGKFKALQAISGQVVATAEGISGSAPVTVQPGPLALLKVTPEAVHLTAGDTAEIIVMGYDAFGNPVPAEPVWQITEGMGTVNRDAVFTAHKAGEGRIVVVVGHLAAVLNLQVDRGEVAALRVSPSPSRVPSGQQQQFTAAGFDRGGNAVPVSVTWEVQGNSGSIDAATGLFTATIAEAGSVVARAGALVGSAEVLVEPGEVASLRLTPTSASLIAGEQLELRSEAFDAAGNRSSLTPTWTVTEEMGTISEEAVFQARRAGSGQLIARLGNVQQTIDMHIQAGPLATITPQPATLTISAGSKHKFAAAGADAYGNPVPVEVIWSVQGNIGKIDPAQGTFEAIQAGSGTVVAVMGAIAGLAPVTVQAGVAAHIQLHPRRLTVAAGETATFTATAFDQFNNPVAATIAWTLTAPLGDIAAGQIQARQAGTAEAVARLGDIEAQAVLEVRPGPVTRLQVIPRSLELASGSTQQFRALGYDAYDNMQEVDATWSLSGDIGRLEAQGAFTAGAKGQGQVTAQFANLSSPVEVTVVPGPVQRLLLSPRRAELPATSSHQYTVTGLDAGGNPQEVTVGWALTQGIGNLDQTGQLTPMHAGTGTVVAYTPEALVGTSDVQVTPGPVALLFVTPQPSTLRAGQTAQFLVQGFDLHRNPIPTLTPQWQVYGDIGSIDAASGLFTATHMGWGKVTAVVNGKLGGADVMVEPGMPDAEQSRLVSSRVTVPADDKTVANIIVLVRDQFGNAVTGVRVTLISSRGDHIEQPGLSNDQGVAIGRIRSAKPGLSEISAVAESVRLTNALRLTFNQPGASG